MQLYQVAMQIKWSSPDRWTHVIVCPGGMHTIMSFIGCIGTLMCNSGLEELLSTAFKGITHMMTEKAWPKAFCGLRMVAEAVLEPFVLAGNVTVSAFENMLECARQSRTGRLWIDSLIISVSILLLFVRAEIEGDWLLHMYCLQRMIPYFFAAGHWNYARYIQWHVVDMSHDLPHEILQFFLRGDHVCRHGQGTWNSVFMDQFGEQTYVVLLGKHFLKNKWQNGPFLINYATVYH